MNEDDDVKRKHHGRSPPFPFISLDRALQRTQELAEYSKGHPVRVQSAFTAWKYNPKSSGGIQTIGALKGFGLINNIGGGEDRKVQLSELAKRLFMNPPQDVRMKLLAEAALKPKLISEYWIDWGVDRPPDNDCRWELIDSRGFTEDAAAKFLAIYDATIAFAGLKRSPGDLNESDTDIEGPMDSIIEPSESFKQDFSQTHKIDALLKSPELPVRGRRQAIFPLSEGDVTLIFPADLSAAGYEELGDYLEIFLRKAKREVSTNAPKPNAFE